MINSILTEWGRPFRETCYPSKLPAETCAVFLDDVEMDGADGLNLLAYHNITVELYEPRPDPAAEADFEAILNARGRPWTKQARYWLQSLQRYQVIYEFSYITKI